MPAATRGRAEGQRWRTVKARIIRRDHGICHLCGGPGADSADHLVPESHGGARYDPANLAAVHHQVWPRCNRIRGDRSIDEARRAIADEIARAVAQQAGQATLTW